MILAIDTNCVIPGNVGGLEDYVISLARSLVEHASWAQRVVLLTREENQALFSPLAGPRCQVSLVERPAVTSGLFVNWAQLLRVRPDEGRCALEAYQHKKLRAIRECGADVVHFPGNAINPLDIDAPAVLNIHDLQHRHFPHYFAAEELDNRERWWRASAKRAEAVVASTRFVAADLRREWGISSSKLVVTHPPVDRFYFCALGRDELQDCRRRMRIERPMFLYPASDWLHKNHRRLLEALAQCEGCDLFLTGFPPERSPLSKLVESLGLHDRVRLLGRVSKEELRRLYHCATALILPSEFEASSFPVMEAMVCGCPVAAADVTGLPELVGDCGLTFDPRSVDAIAAAMRRLAVDDHLRQWLSDLGRNRARGFGPVPFVHGLLDAYLTALANHRHCRAA